MFDTSTTIPLDCATAITQRAAALYDQVPRIPHEPHPPEFAHNAAVLIAYDGTSTDKSVETALAGLADLLRQRLVQPAKLREIATLLVDHSNAIDCSDKNGPSVAWRNELIDISVEIEIGIDMPPVTNPRVDIDYLDNGLRRLAKILPALAA